MANDNPSPDYETDGQQPEYASDRERDPAAALRRDDAAERSEPAAARTGGPEETIWTGRTHWKHFGGILIVYAVLAIVLLVLSLGWEKGWWGVLLVLLGGAVLAVRIGITILSTRYTLTTERLFIDRGLISQTKDQTELIRVDDVRVRKSVLDRIFSLGTVDVLSTDQSDANLSIEGVADADGVAEMVRNHMRSARKKSLFIETL